MFRLRNKKLFSRVWNILFSLAMGALLLEFVLKSGEAAVIWTMLICLVIIGATLLALPLELREQRPANRWYRTAYWAAWILCTLVGMLLISAAVVWGISGPTLEEVPDVSSVLLGTGMILIPVGIFVVGGLAVIGYIAQGNEETRQWARSLGQRNGGKENRPAQEDTPPT